MNAFNSKERFNCLAPNYRFRVTDDHPLDLFIGRDSNNLPYLELSSFFTPKTITGTSSIIVKQEVVSDSKKKLRFSLADKDSTDSFYKFIDDIVISSYDIDNANTGYNFIVDRFFSWKRIFGSKLHLSASATQGLIGELLFLKNYAIPHFGESDAIDSWSGSEKTTKDFSFKDQWFEIKTTTNQIRAITISSIEQLESSLPGKLFVYVLEKRAVTSSGITLNSIVNEILNSLSSLENKSKLKNKLLEADYIFGVPDNDNYSNLVYDLVSVNIYPVNDCFPLIHRNEIDSRIANLSYRINLNDIENLKEGN